MTLTPLFFSLSWYRRPHLRRTQPSFSSFPPAHPLTDSSPPLIQSVHLIEFPSLLLPSGVGPGSIVNIACTRNTSAEKSAAKEFWDLQREIKECFGEYEPEAPKLRIRNTTQTSVRPSPISLLSKSRVCADEFKGREGVGYVGMG